MERMSSTTAIARHRMTTSAIGLAYRFSAAAASRDGVTR
jgi:hypothetical protein